jgi:hypothetical protein
MGKVTIMPSPPLIDPIWWEPPTRYILGSVQRLPPSKPTAPNEGAEGNRPKPVTGTDARPESDKK